MGHKSYGVALVAVATLALGQAAVPSDAAPATPDAVAAAASRLTADASGRLTLRPDRAGGYNFLGVPADVSVATPGVGPGSSVRAAADAVLQEYGAAFGTDRPGTSFAHVRTSSAVVGDVTRYQQRVEGVPVLGGQLVVGLRPDRSLSSVLGRTTTVTKVAPPVLSADEAAVVARQAFVKAEGQGRGITVASEGRWILDPSVVGGPTNVGARTTWRFEVTRGEAERRQVMVDDATGSVLMNVSLIEEALNRVVCNDNDTARTSPTPCLSSTPPARVEAQAATGVTDVDLAYDYGGAVAAYYDQVGSIDLTAMIGRDIGGGVKALAQTVRFCYSGQCPNYANAFWNGTQMYYGNGFASADDVVGHEMTHGVTERTSGLFYWGQSGAMNESLSDIMGEIIDHRFATPGDSPTSWRVGEALPAPYVGGLRDMADPTIYGDPDRTSSPNYVREPCCNYSDQDGVHSNSGVGNKTFYLISQGGTFNGHTITGIDAGDPSLTKSAKLWLLVDQSLSSGSDYADEAAVLEQSCQSLLGAGAVTSGDCAAVHEATLATDLRTTPANNPQPADATLTCPTGGTPRVLLDSEAGTPTSTFVAGPTWSRNGISGWGQVAHTNPAAWGSSSPGASGASSLVAATGVALPAGQPAYLFFQSWRLLEYDSAGFYDAGAVEVDDLGDASGALDVSGLPWVNGPAQPVFGSSGNPAAGRLGFGGDSRGYVASRVDLSTYAGRTVKPRFTTYTDSSASYIGWYVDDVALYTCDGGTISTPPGPTPTPSPTPTPGQGAPAPANVAVKGGLGKAVVTWGTPTTGASSVTAYRVFTTGITTNVAASVRSVSLTGLKQGTTYPVTVVPILAAGQPGTPVTVQLVGTSTRLVVRQADSKTKLNGKLLAGAKGVVGATLKLYVQQGKKWVKVATAKTGKGGKYVVKVPGTRIRKFRAVYAGGRGLLGNRSPVRHR